MTEDISTKKLRVGILIPGGTVPAWVKYACQEMLANPGVDICGWITDAATNTTHNLFGDYIKLDRRLFRPQNPAWEMVEIDEVKKHTPLLPYQNLEAIRDLRLDVIINLSLQYPQVNLSASAQLGVWSVRDAFQSITAHCLPGWQALLRGEAISTNFVEAKMGDGATHILISSTFANDRTSLSRQAMRSLWNASDLLPMAINHLLVIASEENHSDAGREPWLPGFLALSQQNGSGIPSPDERNKHKGIPTLWQLMKLAGRQLEQIVQRQRQVITRKFNRLFPFEQWILMKSAQPLSLPFSWAKFSPLVPPRGEFWADPFIIQQNAHTYLFYEAFPYNSQRGVISCAELNNNGEMISQHIVLDRPYHLSYPHLFEYENTWYLLPETGEQHTIELYRCLRFPDQWVFEKILISDVRAVDTTLVQHGDRWWMFTCISRHDHIPNTDSLHIFYADNPLSDQWTPHPLNPVVRDVRSARPAGAFIHKDGLLLRPSQDSSQRYGYTLQINRVDELSSKAYQETCIARLQPTEGSDIRGVHTLASGGNLTFVDAIIRRNADNSSIR